MRTKVLSALCNVCNSNSEQLFLRISLDIPDLQPASWRYKALETKYDCELTGRIPSSLYSMTFVDRRGSDVNDVVHEVVDPMYFRPESNQRSPLSTPPDFIVMGHHGRKGPKERKASIGTTADQALRYEPILELLRTKFSTNVGISLRSS